MSAIRPKIRITRPVLAGVSLLLVIYFWWTHEYKPGLSVSARGGPWNLDSPDSTGLKPPFSIGTKSVGRFGMVKEKLPCKDLPLAKEVMVVMKTGVTELVDKLSVHPATTLLCYPTYEIYSDFEETFLELDVKDVLKDVNEELRNNHPDFDLYRRLNFKKQLLPGGPAVSAGRNALNGSELSGPMAAQQGVKGKPSNPGWKLDKWKFLPIMEKVLADHGDKAWYVFVETDTYIMWHNLLNYLSTLDYTDPYYIGAQTWINDLVFAHGGTGFVLSRPAVEKVVHNYQTFRTEWENFTDSHWAGDAVIGKATSNAGVSLTHAWPMFQSSDVGTVDFDRIEGGKRLWCYPAISYHHLTPAVVEEMFIFEQEWILRQRGNSKAILTHSDVFRDYVLPRTIMPKQNWDNHAEDDQGPATTIAHCLRLCFADESCLQYRFTADMRCMTSSKATLGEAVRGVESGWVYDRLKKYYEAQPACGDEGWISGHGAPSS